MADVENKKNAIKELVERGKKKGMLTYKEIIDALEEIDLDPEQIEKVYETIEQLGVEVVGDIDADLKEIEEEGAVEEEDLDDLSVPDLYDAVRHSARLTGMGYDYDRTSVNPNKLLQLDQNLPSGFRIQGAGRLVAQHQRGTLCQRPGNRNTLLLSSGHLGRISIHFIRKSNQFQHMLGNLRVFRLVCREIHIFQSR